MTSRGFDPSAGLTYPAASNSSRIRAARAYPIRNLRCNNDAEALSD